MAIMKENLSYLFIALIALFMAGYSTHMVVGGMVSKTTENEIIGAVLLVLAAVLAFMARDLIKRRKDQ